MDGGHPKALGEREKDFSQYAQYIERLRVLVDGEAGASGRKRELAKALTGGAYSALRQTVSIEALRKHGAFFTSRRLANKLLRWVPKDRRSVFFDPSCGAGDLLLAAAKLLPSSTSLEKTLELWGGQLFGSDLQPEFIQAAKLRLMIAAQQRHPTERLDSSDAGILFPGLAVEDGLQADKYQTASVILLNPPFGQADLAAHLHWGHGRISKSAAFLINAIERAPVGAQICALLPESLRSGSSAARWRREVARLAQLSAVNPLGIFDSRTDIDVFELILEKRSARQELATWDSLQKGKNTLSDHFEVSVGPVVPHREKSTGTKRAFLHSKNCPRWATIRNVSERQSFSGRTIEGPFVVIRRTSRPGQEHRIVGTVVALKEPCAVENHLIVCRPVDGTISTCKYLLKQLRDVRCTKYVDNAIRCRHLTVGVIKSLPYVHRL